MVGDIPTLKYCHAWPNLW